MHTIIIKRGFVMAVAFLATMLALIALSTPAHAASITWDGGGADNKFSTATNWVGDVAPVAGDVIILDTTGMTDGTFNNDLPANTTFDFIMLKGDGSGTFTLIGNSIILNTAILNQATYNYPKFNVELDITSNAISLPVTADAPLTIGASDGSNTLDLGTYGLSKSGEYPLTINSVLSGSGNITITSGNFVANENNTFSGTITIQTGARLKGNGTVGVVAVESGGEVAPGLSPGCLSTGNITYASGATYTVEIDGATVCTQYDQTQVTGTVDLGGATLDIQKLASYTPEGTTEFTIIDNDAVDAVTGTFAGLAEGGTTTVDGVIYTVSYVGGDGNDVVLSAAPVTAPNTGFGPGTVNFLFITLATLLATAGMVIAGRKLQTAKAQK